MGYTPMVPEKEEYHVGKACGAAAGLCDHRPQHVLRVQQAGTGHHDGVQSAGGAVFAGLCAAGAGVLQEAAPCGAADAPAGCAAGRPVLPHYVRRDVLPAHRGFRHRVPAGEHGHPVRAPAGERHQPPPAPSGDAAQRGGGAGGRGAADLRRGRLPHRRRASASPCVPRWCMPAPSSPRIGSPTGTTPLFWGYCRWAFWAFTH